MNTSKALRQSLTAGQRQERPPIEAEAQSAGAAHLKIVVQHHPSRVALLRRFAGLGATVVPDPEPDAAPSAWRAYARCLAAAPEQGHLLILQDDALVPPDLLSTLEGLIEEKSDGLIALFVPALSGKHNLRMRNAALQGFRWCQLDPNEWMPTVATCWPVYHARECLAWTERKYGARAFTQIRADDSIVGAYCADQGLPVWATIPCVVDHDDDVVSLMGGHKKGNPARRAVLAPAWREAVEAS